MSIDDERYLKKLTLFFYLVFLDRASSVKFAADSWSYWQRQKKKFPQIQADILFVEAVGRVILSNKNRRYTNLMELQFPLEDLVGDQSSLIKFKFLIPQLSLLDWSILVLSLVFDCSNQQIATGLCLSEGTIRFKISQALKNLSQNINLGLSDV